MVTETAVLPGTSLPDSADRILSSSITKVPSILPTRDTAEPGSEPPVLFDPQPDSADAVSSSAEIAAPTRVILIA